MSDLEKTTWHVFQFYNAYRLVLIAFFIIFSPMSPQSFSIGLSLFNVFLYSYALSTIVFVYLSYKQKVNFKFLVILSMCCDLIYLNALIIYYGQWSLIAAIFIYVAIAMFSILLPGIYPVFFASLETVILLAHSVYHYSIYGVNTIYYAGIHGTGLFATAITALVLAQWIKKNEIKALHNKREIESLTLINDYIIHRLHSGVMLIDEGYDINHLNKHAKKLFQLDDKTPMNLKNIAPEITNKIDEIKKKKPPIKTHVLYLNNIEVTAHILLSKDYGHLIVFEDNKRTKQHVQNLKLASLGRFTASIAHELRNPLGAISHAAELLQESSILHTEDKRLVEIILTNSERMNILVKNILQLSRRKKSVKTQFNARIFLEKIRKESLFHKQLCLQMHLNPSDIKISFDKFQLEQLLIILIENALKHGGTKGEKLTVELSVFINEYGKVCIEIFDNGQGIPKEIRDNIFEPFYTTSRNGVGLGLFIAKELCEANGASIQLLDKRKGTGFLITFNDFDEI